MAHLKKGLVQIYTGSGKGKTTAALGLAVRAAGAGLKVYIQQFIKKSPYSEIRTLKKISNIRIEQCGRGCFIRGKPKKIDKLCACRGLERARKVILSGKYDLIIMDEINVALHLGLLDSSQVINIITGRPGHVEIVLTGRNCPESLCSMADLVTEMNEVKHPYNIGKGARRGIEF